MLTRRLLVLYISKFSNLNYSQSAVNKKDFTHPRPFSEIPEPKSYPILGTSLDYRSLDGKDLNICVFWNKRHEELRHIFKENSMPGITEMTVFCSTMEDTEKMFRTEGKYPFRGVIQPLVAIKNQLGSGLSLLDSQSKN